MNLSRRPSEYVRMWIFILGDWSLTKRGANTPRTGDHTHTVHSHSHVQGPFNQPHARVFGLWEETNRNRLGGDRPELGLNQEPCRYEGTLFF